MAVDGTLNFDTKIDTDGVEKGSLTLKQVLLKLITSIEDLSKTVDSSINSINFTGVNSGLNQVEQGAKEARVAAEQMGAGIDGAMNKAELSAEELKQRMDAITITRYNDVETDINSLANTLDKVVAPANEAKQSINNIVTPDTVSDIKQASETTMQFRNTLEFIKQTAKDIPSVFGYAGNGIKKAFMDIGASAVMAGNSIKNAFSKSSENNKIKQLIDELDRYEAHLDSLQTRGYYFGDNEYDQTYRKINSLKNQVNDYKKSLTQVDGEQKKATSSTAKLGKESSKTSKSVGGLGKMMNLLKMSLMFSLVFRALSGAMNAVKEGFQNLALYSQDTNRNLSALQTSLLTLKNSFATAFNPILTAITPALQTLINYLSQAITTAGQFFAVFFNGATTFTKAKDAQMDYAASLKKTGKEANKALSPIDKLNNVSDAGGGDSGTPGIPDPSQMFEEVKIDTKITDFVENLKKKLEPVIKALERFKIAITPFAKNIGSGLKWFLNNVLIPLGNWTIASFIPAFLDALGASIGVLNSLIEVFKPYGLWLWENFLKPIAEWTGDAIIQGLNLLTEGLNNLSEWILNNQGTVANMAILIGAFFAAFKIAELIVFLAPFVSMLAGFITSGGLLSAVLGGISTALSLLLSPVAIIAAIIALLAYSFIDLYKNSETFRTQISQLGKTWLEALEPVAEFIKTVLTDAWNQILKPAISFFVDTLIPNLISIFKSLWEDILIPFATFLGIILQPAFKILSDILTLIWKNVVLPLAKALGGVFKEAWNGIYTIMNKTIIPIVSTLIDVMTFLWKKVINPIISVLWEKLKPAYETVFGGIKTVIESVGDVLKGAIKLIVGVLTLDWKKAWEGLGDIVEGVFKTLVTVVKTPINAIIDIINAMISGVVTGINTVIGAINSINFTLPDWVPGVGGKGIGFNLKAMTAPKIPKLATGAVIPPNSQFLALLGDQKRGVNIEAPLETIVEAFKQVVGNTGSGNITFIAQMNGKTIFEETRNQAELYTAQTGLPAFT